MAHCYLLARDQASKNLQGRETILSYMFLKTKLHCIALIATFVTDNLFLTEIQPWRKESPLLSPNGLQFSQPLLLTKPFLPSKLRSLQPKLWSWKIKESSKSETNLLFLITIVQLTQLA